MDNQTTETTIQISYISGVYISVSASLGFSTAEQIGEPEPDTSGSFTSQLQVYRYQTKNPLSNNGKTPRTEPAGRQHAALKQWK